MGIAEAIVNAVKNGLELVVSAIKGDFGGVATDIASFVLRTPVPLSNSAPWSFSAPPSGTVWAALFPIYQEIQYFVIAIFALGLGLTFTTGAVRNSARTRKHIRRLAFYFPLAYWWWWIGGWFLKFNQVLTNALIGGSFLSGMGSLLDVVGVSIVLVVFIYIFGAGALLALGVVYLSRWFVIHIYMVVMPVLFCLKALPFKPIRGFSDSLISKFFPLVLTTVPVAILFRVAAQLIASSSQVGGSGIITGLFAIVTLVLAAILPKFVFQFSGQVQSSVKTAASTATGGAAAAAAMRGSNTPTQQSAAGESGSPSSSVSGSGSGSSTSASSGSGSLRHEPDLDFSNKHARRGAKGVKAAAKAGKKTASATKKGTLGALGGAAKAHEKGKMSEMPTATATAGSAAWQTGEAATSKAGDIKDRATGYTRSAWENQVKRRMQNARKAGQSTVEQARQEARENSDWNDDDDGDDPDPPPGSGGGAAVKVSTESQSNTPEADVNTAPGEPAMDTESPTDTTWTPSQGEAYDRNSSDTTVGGFGGSSASSPPTASTNGDLPNDPTPGSAGSAGVSPESMVEPAEEGFKVDEQQAEQAAANIANETDLWELSRENQDEPIYDELGIEDTPDNKAEYTAVQATRHKLYEQANNKGEVPYSDRNSPGGTNDYTFEAAGEADESSDQSQAAPAASEPTTAASSSSTDGTGGTTTNSVSQDQPNDRNASDTETGSSGSSESTSETSTDLTETERAVQEHLETNGQSPDDVSHASVAGNMMGHDQIDGPGDVTDALDTLRTQQNEN